MTPGSKKATRLCRCGLGGAGKGACGRAPRCIQQYQGRISGPLMDRIDLHVEVPPVTAADLALPPAAEGTREAAARVAQAREAQEARAVQEVRAADALAPDEAAQTGGEPRPTGDPQSGLNARLEGRMLEAFATPDENGRALLTKAAEAGGLSARGWTRTLRLARTIADLDGATGVRRIHVAEALIYRRSPLGEAAAHTSSANFAQA